MIGIEAPIAPAIAKAFAKKVKPNILSVIGYRLSVLTINSCHNIYNGVESMVKVKSGI